MFAKRLSLPPSSKTYVTLHLYRRRTPHAVTEPRRARFVRTARSRRYQKRSAGATEDRLGSHTREVVSSLRATAKQHPGWPAYTRGATNEPSCFPPTLPAAHATDHRYTPKSRRCPLPSFPPLPPPRENLSRKGCERRLDPGKVRRCVRIAKASITVVPVASWSC